MAKGKSNNIGNTGFDFKQVKLKSFPFYISIPKIGTKIPGGTYFGTSSMRLFYLLVFNKPLLVYSRVTTSKDCVIATDYNRVSWMLSIDDVINCCYLEINGKKEKATKQLLESLYNKKDGYMPRVKAYLDVNSTNIKSEFLVHQKPTAKNLKTDDTPFLIKVDGNGFDNTSGIKLVENNLISIRAYQIAMVFDMRAFPGFNITVIDKEDPNKVGLGREFGYLDPVKRDKIVKKVQDNQYTMIKSEAPGKPIIVEGTYNKAVVYADILESTAYDQLKTLCSQAAFKDSKIRVMPDCHAGKGCTIGFTADLGEKVIPNIVGVDIGCGMRTIELGNMLLGKTELAELDKVLHERIPVGMSVHPAPQAEFDLKGLRCYSKLRDINWIRCSAGSLGGGNHFIEVDEDSRGNKYLVIHTGSRNLGSQVAEYYQRRAVSTIKSGKEYCDIRLKELSSELISKYKSSGKERDLQKALADLKNNIVGIVKKEREGYVSDDIRDLPDELCYLVGAARDDYIHDMEICQQFAVLNRQVIGRIIIDAMGWREQVSKIPANHSMASVNGVSTGSSSDSFGWETIHNYLDVKNNIIRKGAISAQKGERVLIPINMRDGSLICIGKGNPDWNYSAPHGAGRLMGRRAAANTLSMDEYRDTMKNVYTTCITDSTIDESPMAYKPVEYILSQIVNTVDITDRIKPIYNFKATVS